MLKILILYCALNGLAMAKCCAGTFVLWCAVGVFAVGMGSAGASRPSMVGWTGEKKLVTFHGLVRLAVLA